MQVENLKAKLDDLQTTMAEQETTIEVLRAELNNKHEQLGFIADEKVTNNAILQRLFVVFPTLCTFRIQIEEHM